MPIDYSQKIPNNVNLADDRTLQRALEQWQPNFIHWWDDVGPGRLEQARRLPAHGDERRPAGLGAFRLREDAATTAGASSSTPPRPTARSTSATTRASRRGRTSPASTAPTCAASSSRRATPSRRRSSSSAISASPRPRCTTCATCSRSTSRKAATSGRWSTCCSATSAATAARKRTRCSSAARATPTTRASSARSTRRRPTGWRSSCSPTSPTATASSSSRRSPRARFDPLARTTKFMLTEEAHHMFVGESGVSRVLQRTCEVMNELKTDDPQEDPRSRRDRPADDPALPQLPLLGDDRPVRRRPVEQRGDVLLRRG